MARTGRPTVFTQEIADALCEHIAGGNSLRSFAAQEGTPALSSLTLWIVTKSDFSAQYRAARAAGGFAQADDILEMADKVEQGAIDPQSAKVIIDAKKWAAERMSPKHHSPKRDVNHTSSDGSMSPPTKIVLSGPPGEDTE